MILVRLFETDPQEGLQETLKSLRLNCASKREMWEKSSGGAESAGAYHLLQEMIAEAGISPDGLKLYTDEYGKPFLNADVSFSVSHSKGLVVCALNPRVASKDCPIGIDAERMGARNPEQMQRIADRWFSETEQQIFWQDPSEERFLSVWTGKEALAKYLGKGLAVLRECDTTDPSFFSARLITKQTENAVISLAVPEKDGSGKLFDVHWAL